MDDATRNQDAAPTLPQDGSARPRDNAARIGGVLLLATAAATLLAVFGRVAADADQDTLALSLAAISDGRAMYALGGAARLASGVALIAAGWYLYNTWIIRERLGSPIVPGLFAASGAFTAVSGVCAAWLALAVPESSSAIDTFAGESSTELAAGARWLAGKIGFAIAGLALLAAARYQWKAGGALRRIAPVSAVIGVLMQLIWIDAATIMHGVNGIAFVLWLALIGVMLATGRVERQFSAMI